MKKLIKSYIANGILLFLFCVGNSSCAKFDSYDSTTYQKLAKPTQNGSIANSDFYFYTNSLAEDRSDIWKVSVNTPRQGSIATFFGKYPMSALPPYEQVLLNNLCESSPSTCNENNQLAGIGITDMALSPNKRFLAWDDDVSICFGSTCYGVHRLFLFDTTQAGIPPKEILEVPDHVLGEPEFQYIEDIQWSPDGNYLEINQSLDNGSYRLLKVYDMNTHQINDWGQGGLFTWSQDSSQYAYTINADGGHDQVIVQNREQQIIFSQGWDHVYGLCWLPNKDRLVITADQVINQVSGVYIADINSKSVDKVKDIPLDANKFHFINPVCSPDGARVAITAEDKQMKQIGVFVLDVTQNTIIELAADKTMLNNPKWSPNGQLVGLNTIPSADSISNGIAIINSLNGAIIARKEIENATSDWSWAPGGDFLLLMTSPQSLCTSTEPQKIMKYYWQSGQMDQVNFEDRDLEANLKNCKVDLSDPVW
ncbi:MAG: hypothetical protein P4L50_11175 [Anaerolineaceae bacterium]|nr:hypothetical protein [Anaerolineaceae bacterium]